MFPRRPFLLALIVLLGCANSSDSGSPFNDLVMVHISAGTFTMGSQNDEEGRNGDETQHQVTLTHDFEIGATEVTQGMFEAAVGYNPSYFAKCGDDCPVEYVTWHEAAAFANAVSEAAGLSKCFNCISLWSRDTCMTRGNPYECDGYRLPTEAEWEYAARAGATAEFADGGTLISGSWLDCAGWLVLDNGDVLDDFMWYCGNASSTHPVASLKPNAWGLYDMSGNVRELTWDLYDSYPSGNSTDPTGAARSAYPSGTLTDPTDTTTGDERTSRGGDWLGYPYLGGVARRLPFYPTGHSPRTGLRLARTLQ